MLAEKPLNFSEIQESLAIDSGHLNYHLESLSDLITHLQNGKYGLSSIGLAAIKLMSGVEEHQPQNKHEKLKTRQIISTVYPLILVGALLIASLFALNYSVLSTASLASEQSIPTMATIFVGTNKTVSFNVTTERVPWTGAYNIKIDSQPLTYSEFSMGGGPNVSVGQGFDPLIKSITLKQWDIQKLYLGLNITSGDSGTYGSGLITGNYTVSGVWPVLPLVMYRPNGSSSEWIPQWNVTGSHTVYTIPSNIDITAPGKYEFELSQGNLGGKADWTGFLTVTWAWQSIERPYFYYGFVGLIIALGYITFVTVGLLQKRKTKNPSIRISPNR
jgi:hypothetical protein